MRPFNFHCMNGKRSCSLLEATSFGNLVKKPVSRKWPNKYLCSLGATMKFIFLARAEDANRLLSVDKKLKNVLD